MSGVPGGNFGAGQPDNVLADLQPGDRVRVKWNHKQERGGYGGEGTVVQVTARQAVIRHPLGYTFCVTRAHLMGGTEITLKRRGDAEMVDLERPVEEPGQMSLPGEPLREDRTPRTLAEKPAESPPAGEPPTPVEALERGIPLSEARVMTPADLTRETAERLLAAGVTKREIMRLYSYKSSQGFFGRLQKWGLHVSAKAKSHREAPAKTRRKEMSLEEAILHLDRARESLKSVTLIINQQKDLLTEEVAARLIALETEFAKDVKRYETALKNTKVVI